MKNKKYIKIFALTLFFMICLSVNANVNAETNYYDENNVMYRLIFDDTQLKNFVQRDFALYYNSKDMQNEDIAKLQQTTQSGSYTYSLGFAKNKKLNMVIFEFSEEWQKNNNEKYIAIILPDYIAGNYGAISPRIYDDVKITKGSSGDYNFYAQGFQKSGYGLEMLNFNKNESGVSVYKNGESALPGNSTLNIIIDKSGNIQRVNDMWNKNSTLMNEINTNTNKNIIYSSLDIWNWQLTEIVKPKEDFEERNITYTYEKVKNNELYDIEFSVKGLKKGDKIFLGNYDSDNEKYLQQFNIISNTENPNARFVFNDISKNARIDILIKDEKDNILISESVNIDIDIFEDLKNGNINDFFTYVKNFINNKINKPIKNIMNSFQLLFNRLDVDLQIGIVIIFLIMIIFGIFRFLMKG